MIVIIDYGIGNIFSVKKAFDRLDIESCISNERKIIENAEKLILPGVGNFSTGMKNLNEYRLIKVLNKLALDDKVPILGICLGMQLMTKHSEEGNVKGLGWFDAQVKKFDLSDDHKVPHMGWNNLEILRKTPLFDSLDNEEIFYFVHSFYVDSNSDISTLTKYEKTFISSIQKSNIFGVQFHPEKSHDQGLKILKNFSDI